MTNILNELESQLLGKTTGFTPIHIRTQQRTTRKCITIVEGITGIDLEKILKKCKKKFSCGGSIDQDKEGNRILKLAGNQTENITNFLIKYEISDKDNIRVHG